LGRSAIGSNTLSLALQFSQEIKDLYPNILRPNRKRLIGLLAIQPFAKLFGNELLDALVNRVRSFMADEVNYGATMNRHPLHIKQLHFVQRKEMRHGPH